MQLVKEVCFSFTKGEDLPSYNYNQLRLNNLMMFSIHKDRTDQINLQTIINEFVSANERRINIFGRS